MGGIELELVRHSGMPPIAAVKHYIASTLSRSREERGGCSLSGVVPWKGFVMDERIVPRFPESTTHREAKKLIYMTLVYSVMHSDCDDLLDGLFVDPEQVVELIGASRQIRLTPDDIGALRNVSVERFKRDFQQVGGHAATVQLVNCLDRVDMPSSF